MRIITAAALLFGTLAGSAQTASPTDSALVSQGWQLLLERNGHQYWLWDEDMEWEPARAMCESLGAYLYWPNDAEEHDALWQTVPKGIDGIHFWTAIHQDFNAVSCDDANGGWAGPNNEPQTFFLWKSPGEPSNGEGKESVVQFEWSGDGKYWNDAPGQVCDEGNNCECRFSRVILERQTPTFCDDPAACNFIEGSLSDDECDYSCCPGPGCCHQGTVWDIDLEQCRVANPADINLDGCVQLNDLLDLLSAYGDCGAEESPWQCGDALEYQGYDYATVLIGDQCWFAENLRNENYENGDAIPAGLGNSEWSSTTSGATAVYGEGSSTCSTNTPDGDACDEAWSLNEYGRLYNWYAVDDSRGLCPSGWDVPTDGEWTVMTDFLGGAGGEMKTTYGWYDGGNGTNSSGFSGLPGGKRDDDSYFRSAGYGGFWWSSSPNGSGAWSRVLSSVDEYVFRGSYGQRNGFSVRCVRDADLGNPLFSCGDPVSYQGYDYATVLIGDQCWFAENLRSEYYDNGEAITAGLSDSEWSSTTSGATAVYGEDAVCNNFSPDIDACDPAQSMNEYGRFYNWYAVDDVRGLCASGWHVPTDEEWTVMTDFLGGSSVAGGEMKTTYGWYGGGNGTNSSGFSGLPGGDRFYFGYFLNAGSSGFWWSSSPSGSLAWIRGLGVSNESVGRSAGSQRFGFSVRCVRDAE